MPSSTRRYRQNSEKLKSLNRDYIRLRQVKSADELDWLRIGAHFSDLGMAALRDGLKPGLNERELGDLVERAYVPHGATNVIHYIGVTSMNSPDLGVPRQFPRMRHVQAGDVVVAEISAAFWEHPGQVLRSFALGEPNRLYRELHAAADAAFDAIAAVLKAGATPAQVIEASGVIEDAGFTIIDDLSARLWWRLSAADPRLQEPSGRPGATGTVPRRTDRGDPAERRHRDGKAGVQTGEMVVITDTGIERLHSMPRGFLII